MPYEPPPELAGLSLTEIAALVAARRLPPLERWAPTQILDSHMRIAADGRWFHMGAPISRPARVRAFSSSVARCSSDSSRRSCARRWCRVRASRGRDSSAPAPS